MNTARTVISVVIVMIGLFANINSDVIDEWLDEQTPEHEVESEILVGVQSLENWLVIPVSFEGDGFNRINAETILNGQNSASTYMDQISGGNTLLNATILPETWITEYEINLWGEDGEIERDSGS